MKKIAVINDLSGLGRCSLTAAIPIISVMGIECCPLPTAVLSNQTGYDSFFCDDFTDKIDFFTKEWKKADVHFDAILTGYLASYKQAEKIIEFLHEFKTPDTMFLCDPVMADDGEVYDTYDNTLCGEIKKLAALADIITPNLTELCILTGSEYLKATQMNNSEIAEIAKTLLSPNLKTVIVTGVHRDNLISNIIVTENETRVISSRAVGGSYSGTGDIFSAVVCGKEVKGQSPFESAKTAVDLIGKAIESSYKNNTDRNDGVDFQKYLGMLL